MAIQSKYFRQIHIHTSKVEVSENSLCLAVNLGHFSGVLRRSLNLVLVSLFVIWVYPASLKAQMEHKDERITTPLCYRLCNAAIVQGCSLSFNRNKSGLSSDSEEHWPTIRDRRCWVVFRLRVSSALVRYPFKYTPIILYVTQVTALLAQKVHVWAIL